MKKLLLWTSRYPVLHLALSGFLYFFGVFAHNPLSQPFNWLAEVTSLQALNLIMQLVALVILSATIYPIYRSLQNHPFQNLAVGFSALTLTLFILAYFILMPYKSEFMHFPQYALIALLLVALVRNFFSTLCLGALLGFMDEGYQFIGLHKLYFDFNDVILNIIGTACGLMIALVFWPVCKTVAIKSRWTAGLWYILLLSLFILFISGTVHFFVDEGAWHWHRNIASAFTFDFWIISDVIPRWHLVTPYEGIGLLAFLPLLYWHLRRYEVRLGG